MLYLVMGKRTPKTDDFFEWPQRGNLEYALIQPDTMPARFFDRTLIEDFLDATERLTPGNEMPARLRNGYVDYIFDNSHSPVVLTCMIYSSKAEFDAYYNPRAELYANFRAARNRLLNLFNLEHVQKNSVMMDLEPGDIDEINVMDIFTDPNIPNDFVDDNQ